MYSILSIESTTLAAAFAITTIECESISPSCNLSIKCTTLATVYLPLFRQLIVEEAFGVDQLDQTRLYWFGRVLRIFDLETLIHRDSMVVGH